MEEFIRSLAARSGWTDATTVVVLAGTLARLVEIGAADQADLEAMIRSRGNADDDSEEDDGPEIGDVVLMHKTDAYIVVEGVPDEQPNRAAGKWAITDQYGEIHIVERESVDAAWYVVVPSA